MIRLVRTADRDAEVIGLGLGQLRQLDAELVEVQPGNLFVDGRPSGTTPMSFRRDAGLTAARLNAALRAMTLSGRYGREMRAAIRSSSSVNWPWSEPLAVSMEPPETSRWSPSRNFI